MAELSDYSGKFLHGVVFEDFSSDTRLKLMKLYCRIYLGYIGMVDTVLKQYVSAELAAKIETDIYNKTMQMIEAPGVTKLMNIQGNDVITMIKLMQMVPEGARADMYGSEYDVKNNNHVIWTVKNCPSLNFWEKKGDKKAIEACCSVGGIEEETMKVVAGCINPDIKIKALKLPPRKSKDEIACQWELKIE